MKQILIEISKNDIFKQVDLQSAYAGVKNSSDSAFFQKVASVKEDRLLLEQFWMETCGKVTQTFKTFLLSYNSTPDNLTMTLETSGSYDENLSPSVKDDIFNACVAGVTAGWFQMVLPAKAEEYFQQCSTFLTRAFAKLCHRRRPSRVN